MCVCVCVCVCCACTCACPLHAFPLTTKGFQAFRRWSWGGCHPWCPLILRQPTQTTRLLASQTMLDQDNLYTVLSRSDAGTDAHVVGAIMEYIFAPDDHDVAIEKLAAPETRIVSLTVTEKGYCQNVAGVLDMSNPMVMHDLQDLDHPQTALGMITAGMLRRCAIPSICLP